MRGFKLVLSKELARVLKDKKMIFSMFILPVIIIVGIYGLLFNLAGNRQDEIEKYVSDVCIVNAPESFKTYITGVDELNKVHFEDADYDALSYKAEIKEGSKELLIVFPENFEEGIKDTTGKNIPEVCTFYNPSEDYSANTKSNYTVYLEEYRQTLLSERIGDLSKIIMFSVDTTNPNAGQIYDDAKASGKILGIIVPYILCIMLFAGAMGLGVDTFTGEKERGTMASLLITPVNRMSIAMGKIVALMILSLMSAAVYVISIIISMPMLTSSAMSDGAIEGMIIKFTGTQIVELALIVVSLVYLYVTIVSAIAVLAKTSKEATSYVSPAYMAVLVIGMLTMYGDAPKEIYKYCIPLYNGSLALKALFAQSLTPVQCIASVGITFLTAFLLTFFIAKMFDNEKIMGN